MMSQKSRIKLKINKMCLLYGKKTRIICTEFDSIEYKHKIHKTHIECSMDKKMLFLIHCFEFIAITGNYDVFDICKTLC